MAIEINRHEVVFNSQGIPNVQLAGYVRQGSKNVDTLSVRFEGYNSTELIAIFNGERADGDSVEPGLMMHSRTDEDGIVWYDFTFGEQEPETHPFSWFTAKEGFININILLMDEEQVYVNGVTKIGVEETYGFSEDVAKEFQVISGILEELSKRATYDYVNQNAIQPLIEHNSSEESHPNIREKIRTKLNKDFSTFVTYQDGNGKQELKGDETFVFQDVDGNIKKIRSWEIMCDVKTVNNVIPNPETDDLHLDAKDIPTSNDSNVQRELDSKAEVSLLVETEIPVVEVTQSDNSLKLNNKEESELNVAHAVNADNATNADNSLKLNNKNESELNVAHAVNADNADNSLKLNNKNESELNVAHAVNADNATNAINATYVQYASTDTSKGTIEERLTNLGFKDGSITFNESYGNAATYSLKRQGNYVIGQIVYKNYVTIESNIIIGTLPENFRPSSDISIGISGYTAGGGYLSGNYQTNAVATVFFGGKITSAGEIKINVSVNYPEDIFTLGCSLEIRAIYFGFEVPALQ